MIILTCSMVWRKLNQAWLSSSSISKLRFSSIIMLPSYSSIKSPFWLDYSADSSVAGFFLNPKSVRLQLQEIFFAFGVFFSRLKIQSERTINQCKQFYIFQFRNKTWIKHVFSSRDKIPWDCDKRSEDTENEDNTFLVNYYKKKKINSRSQYHWLCDGISP